MKDNVNKVLERDAMLTDMEEKSESLRDGAQRFERTSTQVKNKMLSKNMKWTIAIVVLVLIIVAVVLRMLVSSSLCPHASLCTLVARTAVYCPDQR